MRYLGFDCLRGLAALFVLIYHMLYWTGSAECAVWGRYLVYTFFTLSGASIYFGYEKKIKEGLSIRTFLVERYARIAPLFVAVLMVQSAYLTWSGTDIKTLLLKALLNCTLLFGFASPGTNSIVVGGWSLGIEFVFYAIFPLIALGVRSNHLWKSVVAAFVVQNIFVNLVLPDGRLDEENWSLYTQPLAFCFYFVCGCYLSVVLRQISKNLLFCMKWLAIPLLSLFLIYGWFSGGAPRLTGYGGVLMQLSVGAIVLSWGCVDWSRPVFTVFSKVMGNASYGMYLLHPITFVSFKHLVWNTQTTIGVKICEVAFVSFALALVLDHFFEKPLRRLITQWNQRAELLQREPLGAKY